MIPRYKHDCKACVYVGQYQEYDLYACPQYSLPTIIARYSSEGSHYLSADVSVALLAQSEGGEALRLGLRKAVDRGLVEVKMRWKHG